MPRLRAYADIPGGLCDHLGDRPSGGSLRSKGDDVGLEESAALTESVTELVSESVAEPLDW